MKVAVTGGIGCGKCYVCGFLRRRGMDVYDCDSAAKRLMRTSLSMQDSIRKLIGAAAYTDDGILDKAVVSRFLLASPDNAARLNAIVHPAVAADFEASGMQWMECAILFTSSFDRLVDRVVCVTAPLELRLNRIMERDGISRDRALEWIECQMPQEEVLRRSDFEIVNDGTADVDMQIARLLESLF